MMVSFTNLPDDVLLEINTLVCLAKRLTPSLTVSRLDSLVARNRLRNRSGYHVLIPISMTCSRLRALCIPTIFRVLGLREDTGQRELHALAVLEHVRVLEVHYIPSDEFLSAILRATTGVQEVFYHRCATFHPAFLGLRSLRRLTINDDCVPRSLTLNECMDSQLRSFFMMSSPPWTRHHFREEIGAETAFVQSVLALAHQSLEAVVLPAHTVRLSQLAGTSWPCLQELAICGAQPPADFPLVHLLCLLPLLRVLTLSIAPRRGDPPFLVWPPGTELLCPPDLDRLDRLTISFPQQNDLLFGHISSLGELSLRDTPRFYLRTERRANHEDHVDDIGYNWPGPILTCANALRIFQQLSAPTNSCANLRRLELVVQSQIGQSALEADLYAQIAASCPHLRHFELHRYRDAALSKWDTDARAIPIPALIDALRAFTALHALRLNLDFPRPSPFDDPDAQPRETELVARRIAAALPWLTSVAFLAQDLGNVYYWRTWAQSIGPDSDLRECEAWRALGDFMDPYWF